MRTADLDVLLPHEAELFGTESWSRQSYQDELADTELRHYLVAEASRRRAIEVLLEVRMDNAAARQLYAKLGFEVIGTRRGYYEQGRVDAVVMRRAI